MSVVFWPRQEILQLVLPQLSSCGRALNQKAIEEVILTLAKTQNPDGKVSLNDWRKVGSSVLKWNDSCVNLFWEMLALAVFYLNPEKINTNNREELLIEIECLAVFLVLHINDLGSSLKASSLPAAGFDSIWPNPDPELFPTSPVGPTSSPSSPARDPNRVTAFKSPVGSPLSPRSPRNSLNLSQGSAVGSSSLNSPKRSSHITTAVAKTPRSATQHLHSVRQKIPIILNALNPTLSEDNLAAAESESYEDGKAMEDDLNKMEHDYLLHKRIVDAFGLMLCGGYSRDQYVTPLSSLHPIWANAENLESDGLSGLGADEQASTSSVPHSTGSNSEDRQPCLASGEFLSWLNLHLSMNDLIYPVAATTPNLSATPTGSMGISGSHDLADSVSASSANANIPGGSVSRGPQKFSTSVASLSRFTPTVINAQQGTTVIHHVNSAPSRSSSFRRINRVGSQEILNSSGNHGASFSNLVEAYQRSNNNTNSNNSTGAGAMEIYETELESSQGSGTNATDLDMNLQSASSKAISISSANNPNLANSAASSGMSSPLSPKPATPTLTTKSTSFSFASLSSPKKERGTLERVDSMGINRIDSSGGSYDEFDNTGGIKSLEKFKDIFLSDNPNNNASHSANNIYSVFSNNIANSLSNISPITANKQELTLPQLFLNYCSDSHFYLISPYYSASLTGVSNCEIVIGAVYGTVILSGCDRIKLSVSCRKLILQNCVDCQFNIATLSPTVILGDCRNLTFGPMNTTYRNIRQHLRMTELRALTNDSETHHTNCWSKLVDANACLDGTNNSLFTSSGGSGSLSPSKSFLKKLVGGESQLPIPSQATATLLAPEDFRPLSIPIKTEYLAFEHSAISIPQEYADSLSRQRESLELMQEKIDSLLKEPNAGVGDNISTEQANSDRDDLATKLLASSTVSKKFMEWLIATDRAQEVLDLIRIDCDKTTNIHQ